MLRRSKYVKGCSPLPLFAILYIAVGMPLLHPVIHNHIDPDHIGSLHGVKQLQAIADEGKSHQCPICNFQATSQLHAAGASPAIASTEAPDTIVSIELTFSVRTCTTYTKPRAPPFPSLI